MDLGPGTDADLLQRALDGEPVERPGIVELVTVLHAIEAVDQTRLAPRAEFVSNLRERLLSEAHPIAATSTADTAVDTTVDTTVDTAVDVPDLRTTPEGASVSVLRVSRPLRHLAAAAAAVILLAGGLGVMSRQAAPGDLLYPIKQVLDRAAVQLAGSTLDAGLTHVAQAEQHVAEARELIDRGDVVAEDLSVAFDAAAQSTTSARALLLEVYRTEGRPEALTSLADFVARTLPQVEAMRPAVPAGAVPAWERLHGLLAQTQLESLRELTACSACGERAAAAELQLELLLGGSGVATPGLTVGPVVPPAAGLPGAPEATVPAPLPTEGTPLPGVSVAPPPATIGSATVSLPGVGITTSDATVGGGGVTLPSATISLPTIGLSSTVAVGGGGVTLSDTTLTAPSLSVDLDPTLP